MVDSSVLIAHLRGDAKVSRWLQEHATHGPLIVPALVAWELWRGATTPQYRERVATLLDGVVVDPFVAAMARMAGELDVWQRGQGRAVSPFDLLIAAHALHQRVPLATLDRTFDQVRGLDVLRPPTA